MLLPRSIVNSTTLLRKFHVYRLCKSFNLWVTWIKFCLLHIKPQWLFLYLVLYELKYIFTFLGIYQTIITKKCLFITISMHFHHYLYFILSLCYIVRRLTIYLYVINIHIYLIIYQSSDYVIILAHLQW